MHLLQVIFKSQPCLQARHVVHTKSTTLHRLVLSELEFLNPALEFNRTRLIFLVIVFARMSTAT